MIRSFQFDAAPFLPPMGTEQIIKLSYILTLRKTHATHMHSNIEPFNIVEVNTKVENKLNKSIKEIQWKTMKKKQIKQVMKVAIQSLQIS